MTTLMPRDVNDTPIPALRLKQGGAHSLVVGASSARTPTAFSPGTRIISLYSDVPVYIAFGDDTVTADNTTHYFPAGFYYDVSIGGDDREQYTHLAALQVENSGTLYISEKE